MPFQDERVIPGQATGGDKQLGRGVGTDSVGGSQTGVVEAHHAVQSLDEGLVLGGQLLDAPGEALQRWEDGGMDRVASRAGASVRFVPLRRPYLAGTVSVVARIRPGSFGLTAMSSASRLAASFQVVPSLVVRSREFVASQS